MAKSFAEFYSGKTFKLVKTSEIYHQGFYSRMALWLLLDCGWRGPGKCTVGVCQAVQAVFIYHYKTIVPWNGMVSQLDYTCCLHFCQLLHFGIHVHAYIVFLGHALGSTSTWYVSLWNLPKP